MENLPLYIPLTFILTVLLTLAIFHLASRKSSLTFIVLLCWLLLLASLGILGFASHVNQVPPNLMLLVFPNIVFILVLFNSKRGKAYIDALDIRTLTLLHSIRVPVELVLYWLFLYGLVPELMTFEGRNFDILAGISAPIFYYLSYVKNWIQRRGMIVWNLISLGLLINIVVNGSLSLPTSFQQFGLEQPNVAMLYFPYLLLPTFVVPIVFFSHLVCLRKLIYDK